MNNPGSIGSLFANNITVPGFSMLFPDAHCLADYSVCQLTTGESEINAAVTIASLVSSSLFDLTTTYFMIAGIAGISPEQGTTGDVAFSQYAIQVALQYEFDAREKPENFSTGYFPQVSLCFSNVILYNISITDHPCFRALMHRTNTQAQSTVLKYSNSPPRSAI